MGGDDGYPTSEHVSPVRIETETDWEFTNLNDWQCMILLGFRASVIASRKHEIIQSIPCSNTFIIPRDPYEFDSYELDPSVIACLLV